MANQPFNNGPPLRIDHLEAFYERFATNQTAFAIQQQDGSYLARREPLTSTHFLQHLAGNWTIAVYAASESRSRWACIDVDQVVSFDHLVRIQADLYGEFQVDSVLEASRRGGHLWLFPPRSRYSRHWAGALAKAVAVFYELQADLFPKLGGLGGCVRLPLGIHRKTGLTYPLWDRRKQRLTTSTAEALQVIAQVRETPWDFGRLRELARVKDPGLKRDEVRARNTRPSTKVQAIRDLVTPRHLGFEPDYAGMMSCPLHPPDKHPSFHWNEKEKLWCCFHEDPRVGGDIIDLYRLTRNGGHGIPRDQAVDELYQFVLRDRALANPEPRRPAS